MAKTRRKRARSRRVHQNQTPKLSTFRTSQLRASLALFLISLVIFAHQCLLPIITHNRFLKGNPYYKTNYRTAPKAWFKVAASTNTKNSSAHLDIDASQATNQTDSHFSATVQENDKGLQALQEMPDGPHPLPKLDVNETAGAASAGASWTGSLAQGVLTSLPLHWVAEMMHRAPDKQEAPGVEERESIFMARRKGAWMGCESDFHLVCKGVYRAIKVTNAVKVVDLGCVHNAGWLPYIVNKLRGEFRLVQLTCMVKSAKEGEDVKWMYRDVEGVQWIEMDGLKGSFPNGTDMLVAYKFLEKSNLIEAMKFFKMVKHGGHVGILAIESYPSSRNKPSEGSAEGNLHINTALAPFWFPPAMYEYENVEENPIGPHMRIIAVKVEEMLKTRGTLEMRDLMDPRRRRVVE